MKQKITKSKVMQNCMIITAGVVLAGGIGFQVHQKHELNEELTALESKQEVTVSELQAANKSVNDLSKQSQNLSHQNEKLQKDLGLANKKSADLQKKNTDLSKKNQQLNIQLSQLTAKAERNYPRQLKITSSVSIQPTSTKTPVQTQSNNSNVKQVVYGKASAYTANCEGCSGITASGERVKPGMVAMARWVPLGTKVRITSEAAPYINGVYTVSDRGGAIDGNRVDIFMESHQKAVQFGMRDIKIEILD